MTGAAVPPKIDSARIDPSGFVLAGTGGVQGESYYVLTSTNVAAPFSMWLPVATNTFGPGGEFSYTNALNSSAPAVFFRLQLP